MDVYRPFPTQEPPEAPAESPPAEPPAAPPLPRREPAPATRAPLTTADEVPARADRAEPDTEHPGGHLHGVVARLNRPRRFGFLRADDGVEVFFHASALEAGPSAFDALRPGQEMEFDCHQDEQGRGLAASLVTIVGEPPPEAPRPARPGRPDRAGRAGRAGGTGWHVAVLHDRYDAPASQQLERLLNERGVRPGNFTLSVVEREEGTECWVAYHLGDDQKRA
jgi:cold shock CspA family protein